MPLPAAPAGAIDFLMGGPTELVTARAVPSPDHLSGPLRDAARDARRAVTTYDEIHAAGRALLDRATRGPRRRRTRRLARHGRRQTMPEPKLLDHDAELADQAERLTAAAGAVVAAVRDLEAVAPEELGESGGHRRSGRATRRRRRRTR